MCDVLRWLLEQGVEWTNNSTVQTTTSYTGTRIKDRMGESMCLVQRLGLCFWWFCVLRDVLCAFLLFLGFVIFVFFEFVTA